MKKRHYTFHIFISAALILLLSSHSFGQQKKLAQTGMKFLSVSVDPRASALGEAVTSLQGSSESMFYNPAGMASMQRFADLTLGQTSWIADIDYIHASVAFQPFGSDYYGVFGFSVVAVNYGEFNQTIIANNEQGFLDVGTFSPSAFSIGFGYARMLSEKFSVGGNVKYVRQSLGTGIIGFADNGDYEKNEFEVDVFAFDFGIIYQTGFKSLNLGMSVRNFAQEIEYIEEGFQLPLTFKIGASINAMDLIDVDRSIHSLLVSIDASHPRDFSEQLMFGAEYTFIDIFSVRAGYSFPNDERGFSAGVGVKKDIADLILGIDYAYAPFGIFDNVHRISVRFAYQ